MWSFWLMLLCFFTLETTTTISSTIFPFISFLRARRIKERRSESTINLYNDEGEIDQLRNVDIAIGNSSPIVVIQCQNGTLVSYINTSSSTLPFSSINETAHYKFSKLKIRIVGADFVTSLMDPHLCLVVTGLAADCASAIKHTLQFVANATHAYGTAPPGELIANSIADMFLKSTIGSDRPFACHAFLCDMRKKDVISKSSSDGARVDSNESSNSSSIDSGNGFIYDIEPSGNIQQIFASVVGSGAGALTKAKGKTSGYDILESEYESCTCNLESAKKLAEKVLSHCVECSGWLSEYKDDEMKGGNATSYYSMQTVHELIPY